ncbi:hypothetical protein N0V93_009217 [Gnomoniopsis smithogilvyi]|uniref:Rhodopsin domain-containing protein n=1 Tax=Gnomoniopsis smithogilvyi TaxID=1191159 RepID=A0A9W9CTF8_9PEZI|nr:hypothetical protein N0V93_009217 [Gnomoniopsis smithogilvyi]
MASDAHDTSGLSGDSAAYRGGEVIACAVIFIVFCTMFLALRFWSYRLIQRKIFFEDWLIIPSYILMMGICADTICCVKYGYVGRHLEWVEDNVPTGLIAWAQTLFVMQLLFGFQVALTKTSILLLYRRIFQKIALTGVFLLGSFGSVASAIRTYYFFELNELSDNTWNSVQLMSWACAEAGMIFVCACLPSLWPLIRKSFLLKSKPSNNAGDVYWEQKQSQGPQVWSEHGTGRAIFGSPNHFIPLEDRGVEVYGHSGKLSTQASSTYMHTGPRAEERGISVRHDITQESSVTPEFNRPPPTYNGRC